MGRKCTRIPTPPDAREVIQTMFCSEAARHYGVSVTVLKRWRAELRVRSRPRTAEDDERYGRKGREIVIDLQSDEPRKVCTCCDQSLPLSAYRRATGSTTLRAQCRICCSARRKQYRMAVERAPKPEPAPYALTEMELYRLAMRALSTSPPVPAWEREEWA